MFFRLISKFSLFLGSDSGHEENLLHIVEGGESSKFVYVFYFVTDTKVITLFTNNRQGRFNLSGATRHFKAILHNYT